MARPLKLAGQTLALALVAGLLALLVWKVVHEKAGTAASALAHGKQPTAPAFDLPRLDGRGKLSLASLKGKVVVINFWATWCDPCKREAPLLAAAHHRWQDRGVAFVGVDVKDFAGDARRFLHRHGLTYPNVKDGAAQTADRYGAFLYPETFLVDRRGRVVERIAGQLKEGQLDLSIGRALRA